MRCHLLAAGLAAAILCMSPLAWAGSGDHGHGHGHGHAGHGKHGHKMRAVPAEAKPRILLTAASDTDGYNLRLQTPDFRFSPERTGLETDKLEGHAHLYVNGEKKARIYGSWFHLPARWLVPGANLVQVSLNDTVHAHWAVDGAPVMTEIVVSHGDFDGRVIERTLGGEPETFTITTGARVQLLLTTPEATELHLHGYDLSDVASPRRPAIFTFRADHAGRFAIEAHGGDDLLGRKARAVAYIEVRSE